MVLFTRCSSSTESTKTTTEEIDYIIPENQLSGEFELPKVDKPVLLEDKNQKVLIEPNGSFQAEIRDDEKRVTTTVKYKAPEPATSSKPYIPAKLEVNTLQQEKPIKAVKTTTEKAKVKETENIGDWFKDVFTETFKWIAILIALLVVVALVFRKIFPGIFTKIIG